jgi:hypothetical protein
MSKNRAKAANVRAKKAKERSKDRAIERARKAVVFKAKKATSLAHFVSDPSGYEFWYLHGPNFILSSYGEGVWSPLFPEIYNGKAVSRSEVFKRVMDKHYDNEKEELSDSGTKALLWCSLKPGEMFRLVSRARVYAWAKKNDPKAPASPAVWEFLDKVMGAFANVIESKSITQGGRLHISADKYETLLPEVIQATVSALSGGDPSETG